MIRRRTIVSLFLVLACSVQIGVMPAWAIVNGELDGDGHPSVAALIVEVEFAPGETETFVACSGVLISASPPIVLTAGHCSAVMSTLPISKVWASFDAQIPDPLTATRISAVAIATHPDFKDVNTTQGPNDIGIIELASAPPGVAPARLPSRGLLDDMRAAGSLKGQLFAAVGYGVQATITGPPEFSFDGARRVAYLPFLSMPRGWLVLNQATNATGLGGACFGDSGSPKFLPGTDTIVAIESWGDAICRATSFSWRLDTASSRAFLDDYVALPT